MVYVWLLVGLVLLLGGAEALVKGAATIATRLGVSPLLIGLTLVGYGTSTPELVASIEAAWIGSPGIAVGNIVGSNIANVLLILGASALIYPVATTKHAFRRDGVVLVVASALLVLVTLHGVLSAWTSLGFLALLLAYTIVMYITERRWHAGADERDPDGIEAVTGAGMSLPAALMLAAGGLVGVVIGASLLVGAAVEIATRFGVSETVIGLTLVAVGTSLPELATSVMAALRRHGDLAFGNIVGSNIYNILGILGIAGLVTPVPIPGEIAAFDIWVMSAATLGLVWFAITDWRITRLEGAVFMFAYAAYL
ncbi:MAG: calcium/sodium antiporter, partial [Dichotomicrobium sp.]